MPDYKIGSFKVAQGTPGREPAVIYYATLPFGGKIARVGLKGLFQIIAVIEKQYADHELAKNLTSLREWMQKLTDSARLFEQVRIEIEKDVHRTAFVTDAMNEERRRVIRDEQDLEIFINDRAALDGSEDYEELEQLGYTLIIVDVSTPGM